MKTNLSDAQILKLIHKHYPNAGGMTILSGGLVSQTYAFECNNYRYVMQVGGDMDAYKKEAFVSALVGTQLPVREVLDVHTTEQGIAYCISRYIPGKKLFDFPDDEIPGFSPDLLALLNRVWRFPLALNVGFGKFDGYGKTQFQTWHDFVLAVANPDLYPWAKLADKGFDCGIVKRAISEIGRHADLPTLDAPSLLHGDLGSYNLLGDHAHITGMIDWSLSLYGDPLYDLANVFFWNEDKLQPVIARLKERHVKDDISRRKVYAYMLRIALEEIYNVVGLDAIGYDNDWVVQRTDDILRQRIFA